MVKLISTSMIGIPDLMALRDGVIVFIEVKSNIGVPSKLQLYRIEQLKKMGFEALIARSIQDINHLL